MPDYEHYIKIELDDVRQYRHDHVAEICCQSDKPPLLFKPEAVPYEAPEADIVEQNVWSCYGSASEVKSENIVQKEFDNEKKENRYEK